MLKRLLVLHQCDSCHTNHTVHQWEVRTKQHFLPLVCGCVQRCVTCADCRACTLQVSRNVEVVGNKSAYSCSEKLSKKGEKFCNSCFQRLCTVSCLAKWPSSHGQGFTFAGQQEKDETFSRRGEITAELCYHGWHLFFPFLIFLQSYGRKRKRSSICSRHWTLWACPVN